MNVLKIHDQAGTMPNPQRQSNQSQEEWICLDDDDVLPSATQSSQGGREQKSQKIDRPARK
jgi:hypothetical protein